MQQTYYRWRKQHGGMQTSDAKRMEELEKENERLKKLVADIMRNNGRRINRKRVERIWREEGLKLLETVKKAKIVTK